MSEVNWGWDILWISKKTLIIESKASITFPASDTALILINLRRKLKFLGTAGTGLGIYKRKKGKWENKKTRTLPRKKELVREKKNSLKKEQTFFFFLDRDRVFLTIIVFSWKSFFFLSLCFLERVRVFLFSYFLSKIPGPDLKT